MPLGPADFLEKLFVLEKCLLVVPKLWTTHFRLHRMLWQRERLAQCFDHPIYRTGYEEGGKLND